MKYICELCKKDFTDKSNYNKHINRKNICIKDEIKCRQCNKIFDSLLALKRHLNKKVVCNNNMYYQCEICKKQYLNKYRFNQHMKKIHPVNQNNNENIHQLINNGTINNNNNNGTINNYNITISPFGQEKIDFLEDIKKQIEILNNGYKCMKNLIIAKHYDNKHPENHNLYISDLQRKKIVVYTGEIWEICNKDEIFTKLQKNNIPHITAWHKEYKDNLTEQANKEIITLLKSIDKNGELIYENRLHGGMNRIMFDEYQEDIELVLYNYRDVVKNTIKMIEK